MTTTSRKTIERLMGAEEQDGFRIEHELWTYEWNVRDQLTRAVKYTTTANNVGSVEYEYCLSCDGALSKRFQYAGGTGANPGALQSGRRYEYDGLNLLRVDELYDSTGNGLTEDDAWRRLEVNTHGPGTLGALIGKRVYTYAEPDDSTPSGQNDYTYTYDAVGNVIAVYNANSTGRGNELYYFSQDAFGNELSSDGNLPTWQRVNLLGGSQWGTARTAGITEHQTGKWIDPFTGMYYFHARWLDAGVGRFVGRSPLPVSMEYPYVYVSNTPTAFIDPNGAVGGPPGGWKEGGFHTDPAPAPLEPKLSKVMYPPQRGCKVEVYCNGQLKHGEELPQSVRKWLWQKYGHLGSWGWRGIPCIGAFLVFVDFCTGCQAAEAPGMEDIDFPPQGACVCETPIPPDPEPEPGPTPNPCPSCAY